MKRLRNKDIEKVHSNIGEVECLRWKSYLFEWQSSPDDGIDEYALDGPVGFVYDPKKVYEQLIIKADWQNNIFFLKTGRGKELTWINLLGI